MPLVDHPRFGYAGEDVACRPTTIKVAAYNADLGEIVPVDTTGGAVTITLPDVSDGQIGHCAIRHQAGTALITVDGYGAQTIDGVAAALVGVPGETRLFASDGAGHWTTTAAGGSIAGLGQIIEAGLVNTVAASGATQTIPEPYTYKYSDITLTADCTLTFPGVTQGKHLRMVIRQDAAGAHVVTWPASALTPGGALVITATASAVDYVEAISVVEDEWLVFRSGAAFAL